MMVDGNSQLDAFFRWDAHRTSRTGVPEVVLAESKRTDHLVDIIRAIASRGAPAMVTRLRSDQFAPLRAEFARLDVDEVARTAQLPAEDPAQALPAVSGDLLVVCAGTSDVPVAREACNTARFLGARPDLVADVGVAGLHRLLAHAERLRRADCIVCVAGMEGALPSVVAGLVRAPVVAVPTSVGYGASLGGIAALLAMVSSCAPGVVVVNIDNGFGAAAAAVRILLACQPRPGEPRP